MQVEDVIIIGGGPAGYAAAIYAARSNLRPLCIEGYAAGGQLITTSAVDNYPGIFGGIDGASLTANMRSQGESFGARFASRDATRVDLSQRPFRVEAGSAEYLARALVVATGATPRRLGLPSEDALQSRGVAYCAVCDGAFFAGRRVAVIGGGDAAMEQAIGLTRHGCEVVVVHRRDEFRAAPIMRELTASQPKVSFLTPFTVEEVLGVDDGRVGGVRLRHARTGAERIEHVEGVFVSIGHRPNTELVTGWLEHDAKGYLRVEPGTTRTNVEGVFAAGDVQDPRYRQAVTAAATGCMAALDAERWLAQQGSHGASELPRAA